MIVVMIICGIFSLLIIIANLTIITVILKNSMFPTSQLIYKLSLAWADLLVGVFVFPSFIITFYKLHIRSYQKQMSIFDHLKDKNKNTTDSITPLDQIDSSYYKPEISSAYCNFFGFITLFSLFNSVFTLMLASCDRFVSLSYPLKYKRDKAILYAKCFTVGVYFISFIFAFLPIFEPEMGPYRIVSGGVPILFMSNSNVYIMTLVLSLPLIIKWIFTVGVLINLHRQKNLRKKLTPRHQIYDFKTEKQLSIILSIMVVVFTVCILPVIVIEVLPKFFPFLKPQSNKKLAIRPAALFSLMQLTVVIILTSNSLWNGFIYAFKNKKFRRDAAALYYTIALTLRLHKLKRLSSRLSVFA